MVLWTSWTPYTVDCLKWSCSAACRYVVSRLTHARQWRTSHSVTLSAFRSLDSAPQAQELEAKRDVEISSWIAQQALSCTHSKVDLLLVFPEGFGRHSAAVVGRCELCVTSVSLNVRTSLLSSARGSWSTLYKLWKDREFSPSAIREFAIPSVQGSRSSAGWFGTLLGRFTAPCWILAAVSQVTVASPTVPPTTTTSPKLSRTARSPTRSFSRRPLAFPRQTIGQWPCRFARWFWRVRRVVGRQVPPPPFRVVEGCARHGMSFDECATESIRCRCPLETFFFFWHPRWRQGGLFRVVTGRRLVHFGTPQQIFYVRGSTWTAQSGSWLVTSTSAEDLHSAAWYGAEWGTVTGLRFTDERWRSRNLTETLVGRAVENGSVDAFQNEVRLPCICLYIYIYIYIQRLTTETTRPRFRFPATHWAISHGSAKKPEDDVGSSPNEGAPPKNS